MLFTYSRGSVFTECSASAATSLCHISTSLAPLVSPPVCFCTCLSAVSFSISVPCSLSPSVVKSIWVLICLSLHLLVERRSKEKERVSLRFRHHCTMSYLSCFPLVCERCGNLRGEECVLPGPLEWPPGICVLRGTDQPLTESRTSTETAHSSTKMPWWHSIISIINSMRHLLISCAAVIDLSKLFILFWRVKDASR